MLFLQIIAIKIDFALLITKLIISGWLFDTLPKVSNVEVGGEQNIFGPNLYRVTNHVFLDQPKPAERGDFRINRTQKVSQISENRH